MVEIIPEKIKGKSQAYILIKSGRNKEKLVHEWGSSMEKRDMGAHL